MSGSSTHILYVRSLKHHGNSDRWTNSVIHYLQLLQGGPRPIAIKLTSLQRGYIYVSYASARDADVASQFFQSTGHVKSHWERNMGDEPKYGWLPFELLRSPAECFANHAHSSFVPPSASPSELSASLSTQAILPGSVPTPLIANAEPHAVSVAEPVGAVVSAPTVDANLPLVAGAPCSAATPSVDANLPLVAGAGAPCSAVTPSVDANLPLVTGAPTSVDANLPLGAGAPCSDAALVTGAPCSAAIPSVDANLPLVAGAPCSDATTQSFDATTQAAAAPGSDTHSLSTVATALSTVAIAQLPAVSGSTMGAPCSDAPLPLAGTRPSMPAGLRSSVPAGRRPYLPADAAPLGSLSQPTLSPVPVAGRRIPSCGRCKQILFSTQQPFCHGCGLMIPPHCGQCQQQLFNPKQPFCHCCGAPHRV